jgi:SMI1 / KNR4 family (SUKH-1)
MADFAIDKQSFIIDQPGAAISEAQLAELEKSLGQSLPGQLRAFYLRWNGGLPCPENIPEDKALFVKLDWSTASEPGRSEGARRYPMAALSGLLKINSQPGVDFLHTWNDLKGGVPDDLLIFCRDPGTGLFLIGTGPENLGEIFFWVRSLEESWADGQKASPGCIAEVAESFKDFLFLIREEPLPNESYEAWLTRVYPS